MPHMANGPGGKAAIIMNGGHGSIGEISQKILYLRRLFRGHSGYHAISYYGAVVTGDGDKPGHKPLNLDKSGRWQKVLSMPPVTPAKKPPVKPFKYVPKQSAQEKRAQFWIRTAMVMMLLALLAAGWLVLKANQPERILSCGGMVPGGNSLLKFGTCE